MHIKLLQTEIAHNVIYILNYLINNIVFSAVKWARKSIALAHHPNLYTVQKFDRNWKSKLGQTVCMLYTRRLKKYFIDKKLTLFLSQADILSVLFTFGIHCEQSVAARSLPSWLKTIVLQGKSVTGFEMQTSELVVCVSSGRS